MDVHETGEQTDAGDPPIVARRTNVERRATAHAKILDATAALLAEVGYANTSTGEVAKRAGVSRGALQHHFPTKVELTAATLQWLLERRVAEFQLLVEVTSEEGNRFDAAIDVLWSIFQGPTFVAWHAVTFAAHTDPGLRPLAAEMHTRLRDTIDQLWLEHFPLPATAPASASTVYEIVPSFLFAILEGLAMERLTGASRAERDIDNVLWLTHQLTALLPPLTAPTADPTES
jgi:AcrR family transcriptional regulator